MYSRLAACAFAFRRQADILNPLWFFIIVITLFPLSIGPEPNLLARIAAHSFVRGILSTADRPLLVTGEAVTAMQPETSPAPTPDARIWCGDAWREVPVLHRGALATGERVAGPALVVEPTGTNMIEPGWTAQPDAYTD